MDSDNDTELCLCRSKYENSRFYIQCDFCKNWYHGDCVNISESEVSTTWYCPVCLKLKPGLEKLLQTQKPVRTKKRKVSEYEPKKSQEQQSKNKKTVEQQSITIYLHRLPVVTSKMFSEHDFSFNDDIIRYSKNSKNYEFVGILHNKI